MSVLPVVKEEAKRKSVLAIERNPKQVYLRCKDCGFEHELEAFDVLGADDGFVFCPVCANWLAVQQPENQ